MEAQERSFKENLAQLQEKMGKGKRKPSERAGNDAGAQAEGKSRWAWVGPDGETLTPQQ